MCEKRLEAWFTVLIEAIWGKHRIMEMYLNVAETGIGTYGVDAGALRYFHHDATHMTPTEAARLVAVFPLPKVRGAVAPVGAVQALWQPHRGADRDGGAGRL